MRKRNKPWMEKELDSNSKIINEPESYKGKWKEYFGNDNPIYLEIGCGKGRFSINSALHNDDINYIAFDKELQVIGAAAKLCRETMEEHNVDINIGFIIGDVKNLMDYFEVNEIKRLYINFCDPWRERNKWMKRRLTHHNFLKMYKELLGENGEIFFKTDNTALFDFSLNEFSDEGWRLKNISLDLHKTDFHLSGKNVMTEYEEKFSSKGMPIYRLEAYVKQ